MTPADSRDVAPWDGQEIFFTDPKRRFAISRALRAGRIRRLGSGLYTSNLEDDAEAVVARNLWQIAGGYFRGAVIADRTAFELRPTEEDGSVFLVAGARRDIDLPGAHLRARAGAGPQPGDQLFMGNLYLSSEPRRFLENLRPSRARAGRSRRTLRPDEVEARLDRLAAQGGADALNELRDAARELASQLDAVDEFRRLDRLIGSIQGTRPGKLRTPQGRARSTGVPFDPHRLGLFDLLDRELRSSGPMHRPERETHDRQTLAFYEAYFSNYIEGTEFEVDEAEAIVFEGKIPGDRPADAHDVLGTFDIVSNPRERRRVPHSADELLEILLSQHERLLAARPDKRPGRWKSDPNRAGGTSFVAPDLVEGTLREGFRRWSLLPEGFHRAVFAMFVIAEVHPFDDGNGRIARVLMNGELTHAGEQRVLIPTVYRNSYLAALRALTHHGRAEALVRTLEFAQRYSAAIDFSNRERAEAELQATNAFVDPTEADERGVRLLLPSPGDPPTTASDRDRLRALAGAMENLQGTPRQALANLWRSIENSLEEPGLRPHRDLLLHDTEHLAGALIGPARRGEWDSVARPSQEELEALAVGKPRPRWAAAPLDDAIAAFRGGPLHEVDALSGRHNEPDQAAWREAVGDLLELAAALRAAGHEL